MKRKKILLISGISVGIIVAIVIAILMTQKVTNSQGITTATVSRGNIDVFLSSNATIKSKQYKEYVGAAQLVVKNVNVKVGDQVVKDQVMVTYEMEDLHTAMIQAQSQYDNAVTQYDSLKKQYDDIFANIASIDAQISTLQPNAGDPTVAAQIQDLENKKNALMPISDESIQQADNLVTSMKTAYDAATYKYNKYKDGIVSDIDGTVTQVNATAGYVIAATQPAVIVQQLDNLKATTSIDESDMGKVKVGVPVVLKSENESYNGVVSLVSPVVTQYSTVTAGTNNTSVGTAPVEIDITGNANTLRVGTQVTAEIRVGGATDVLKIPAKCIVFDKDGNAHVYKVVNKEAKKTSVMIGVQTSTYDEIINGLSEKDVVIVSPGASIKDGSKLNL